MCESKLGWPLKAKIDISVGWTITKWRFNIKSNRALAGVWQDDENWTDIQLEKD